jgi:sulfide:quinone oxidoreductase
MDTPSRSRHRLRVVVAGGGVAALEAILALHTLAEDRVTLELVAPEPDFTYRPLAVAEPFRVADIRRFPLAMFTEAAGAELRQSTITAVDPARHVVECDTGEEISYDVLLLALGARPRPAVANALTFRGPEDDAAFSDLLEDALAGSVRRIVFALPVETRWPLPLYELAFLMGNYLTDSGTRGVSITLVTPEDAPLGLFGTEASDAISELLELRGINVRLRTVPLRFEDGALEVTPKASLPADRVVAMPRLDGPGLPGIPHDRHGFVSTDDFGRLMSEEDIYAAGDMTQFPLKQGGIATQQADAAATAIAARSGAPIEPTPFRPILRGLLLTGMASRYLRAQAGTRPTLDVEPLWWPPAKIVGRYLTPFLAAKSGLGETPAGPLREGAIPVEVELDPRAETRWSPI